MAAQLAETFPVGEFLAEELEARDWSQGDFAEILGRPAQFVSEIITGKKEITRESAAQIGAALGTSADYWLNLQNTHLLRLHLQDQTSRAVLADVRRRARLNELAPMKALQRQGIVTGQSLDVLEAELRDLFGVASLDDDPGFVAAARRTNRDNEVTPTQKAWLACARKAASSLPVGPYDAVRLKRLAAQVSQLVKEPSGFEELQTLYASVGVRLVYVEALPGSRLDGAAFLAEDSIPGIALSGRGQRLDKVLFVLLHETAHIVLGHVTAEATFLDEGDYGSDPKEAAADAQALRWALPAGVQTPPTQVRKPWLIAEAERNSVHPIVVLGHLQHAGRVPWNSSLGKAAPTVTGHLATWRSSLTPNESLKSRVEGAVAAGRTT